MIVFLLSDFLDQDFENALKRTGQRHDLIAIHISDPREETLPGVGLLELEDAETAPGCCWTPAIAGCAGPLRRRPSSAARLCAS